MSRYTSRPIVKNRNRLYDSVRRKKDLSNIRQYASPTIIHPNEVEMRQFHAVSHLWKFSDRYYKLADLYYGDVQKWYLIAWFNQRPTEAHINIGDIIYIPLPLEVALRTFRSRRSV